MTALALFSTASLTVNRKSDNVSSWIFDDIIAAPVKSSQSPGKLYAVYEPKNIHGIILFLSSVVTRNVRGAQFSFLCLQDVSKASPNSFDHMIAASRDDSEAAINKRLALDSSS